MNAEDECISTDVRKGELVMVPNCLLEGSFGKSDYIIHLNKSTVTQLITLSPIKVYCTSLVTSLETSYQKLGKAGRFAPTQ